jgi:hypothetical protein
MATPTTLPAAFTAGQVLTADLQNALRGAFRVLQVVYGSSTTQVANATTTLADTGITATITPQSTSNKILVIATTPIYMADGDCTVTVSLQRAGIPIAANIQNDSTSANAHQTSSMVVLDSPATVAATIYKTQFRNGNSSKTSYVCNASQLGSIVLLEISA